MKNPFIFSEMGQMDFPLAEQSKNFDVLPDRELNRPISACSFFHTNPENLKEGLIDNKREGLRREAEVEKELTEKFPESEGYEIISEAYLRDKDGNIVRDPESGTARKIDFIVIKDGKVVDSVEVTSKTADKTGQCAKEQRIRDAGGNFIKMLDGTLVEFSNDKKTRIERRD